MSVVPDPVLRSRPFESHPILSGSLGYGHRIWPGPKHIMADGWWASRNSVYWKENEDESSCETFLFEPTKWKSPWPKKPRFPIIGVHYIFQFKDEHKRRFLWWNSEGIRAFFLPVHKRFIVFQTKIVLVSKLSFPEHLSSSQCDAIQWPNSQVHTYCSIEYKIYISLKTHK